METKAAAQQEAGLLSNAQPPAPAPQRGTDTTDTTPLTAWHGHHAMDTTAWPSWHEHHSTDTMNIMAWTPQHGHHGMDIRL